MPKSVRVTLYVPSETYEVYREYSGLTGGPVSAALVEGLKAQGQYLADRWRLGPRGAKGGGKPVTFVVGETRQQRRNRERLEKKGR